MQTPLNPSCSSVAYSAWLETLIEELVGTKGNVGVLFANLSKKVKLPDPDIDAWDRVFVYKLQDIANNLESMRASLAGTEPNPPFPGS